MNAPSGWFDPRRYHDEAWAARERERLWPRVWLLGAHSSELAPAEALTLQVGALPLLMTRDEHGQVHAFLNACAHRGLLLCAQRRASPCATLRCPYHHWEYALTGETLRAPGFGAPPPAGLVALRCEERFGFVWVCASAQAPSLGDFLGPMGDLLARFHADEMQIEADRVYPAPCNWKVSADVHNEGYHLASLHPELLDFFDLDGVKWEALGRHGHFAIPFGLATPWATREAVPARLRELARSLGVEALDGPREAVRDAIEAAVRASAEREGTTLAELPRVADKHQLFLFPNVHLNFGATELEVYRHRPHEHDVSRSWFDELRLRRRRRGEGRRERPRQQQFEPATLDPRSALGQDFAMLERLQRGLTAPGLGPRPLGALEGAIALMHRGLDEFVGDEAKG